MIANGRTSVVGGDNMGRPEDERVKIPALLHLTRLGYSYLSLQECEHDEETNIFLSIFRDSLAQINMQPVSEEKATDIIQEIRNALDNDDLGREFFKLLQAGCSGLKLIDFEHPDQNSWHVVTELPCKRDQDEFRPDITLLINGLPLVFIEVKRPNNVDGIQAERDRMDRRLRNPKFRRFINMTQLMIFSNNGEYDDSETPPLSGAFYATIGKKRLFFDHFREEQEGRFAQIADLDPTAERKILLDTHLPAIKHHAEYLTNLSPTTPTHRILSSMASRDRLLFLLRYGLVYVDRVNDNGITETEKHVISDNVGKPELLQLQKALTQYREMANVARLYGYDALASSFTVSNASAMLTEVTNRIKLLNQRETLDQAVDMQSVLNIAMDQIQFVFKRISKDEMVIADSYREMLERTRQTMHSNHDPDDPEYVTLLEELQRLLQKKKIEELTAEEMREDMTALDRIRAQAAELNRRDAMLTQRYENDPRFMRIHKRLKANPPPIGSDVQIHQVLMRLKHSTDESVMMNSGILRNEAYFTKALMPQIIDALRSSHVPAAHHRLPE